MSSHRKKKYESDSSSESGSEDSSSSERETKRKGAYTKYKHSSDGSESDHTSKKRYTEISDDSDAENSRHKKHKREPDTKHGSGESNSHRHRHERLKEREDSDKYKKDSRMRDKPEKREYDDKEKYSKDKRDDKGYNREKYDNRDKHNRRDRYDDSGHDRNRNRNYDKERSSHRIHQGDARFRKNDNRRRSSSFDHANAKWGKPEDDSKSAKKEPQQKEKPNFGLSGKLTEETNTYRGVVIKYSEPPEARKPRRRWRLYPFKGEKALQTLYIHRESAYLIGRERKVVDLPVDHPSCSKQHAALQYRLVPFTRENGSAGKRVRPYLIDLESANGTYINNKKMDAKKYYELFERDVIKFGYSSREYVLLHENSKDEALDDDVKMEEEDEQVDVKIKKEK